MASAPPDTWIDALPEPVRHLLSLRAARAITIANEALAGLMAGSALTPTAAAEWHQKILAESTGAIFEAWATMEEADLRLAGLWLCLGLLDQQLRQGAAGINLLRQHDQLPQIPGTESTST